MLRRLLALTLLALSVVPAQAAAQTDGLSDKPLYETGSSGRWLVGGQWLFRPDPGNAAATRQIISGASRAGWTPVTVPHAWNAKDHSDASFVGGVGWYRKDFRLPSSSRRFSWVLRFESVNYRASVYLNGKRIGSNTGAYLPFEVRVPPSALKRTGVNRLVVRVDSRRKPYDFPPARTSAAGDLAGGWWNYGGLLREVYLRRVDRVDITSVSVLPDLPCARCAATVTWRATVRNADRRTQRVSLTARLGPRTVSIGRAAVGPGEFRSFTRRVRVASPRLWSPTRPYLYNTSVSARVGDRTVQTWRVRTGIRQVKVVGGRLHLNGRPLNLRGFGVHEDSLESGFAIGNNLRERQIRWAREAGALFLRSHYPLHPYYYERLDELGMLAWAEVPVYQVQTEYLARATVRRAAVNEVVKMVQSRLNHPSVIIWSIANELSSRPGPAQAQYISAAVRAAKDLDPTRPVGLAVAGYPDAGCRAEYGPLDVVGINEYFGWYVGPNGQIADPTLLGEYLDSVRACYPRKAIMITETGAEANRDGPVEERGTYQFQQAFAAEHFALYASKPWLSGASWWTLEEFWVRPRWEGGNPWPLPALHQKAVVTMSGVKKPAFFELQRIFRATKQYG